MSEQQGIGGFFPLEIGAGAAPHHAGAVALASGRACLRQLIEQRRPVRLWLPDYICDSVVRTVEKTGVDIGRYELDETLDPVLPDVGGSEGLLYVNYFGLKGATARALDRSLGERAIIDDTHAFFEKGYESAASFNSARKFFGVPDGAYLYGSRTQIRMQAAPAHVHYEHLVSRLLGDQQTAFEQYRQSEACVSDEPASMSILSERLLGGVDYGAVRARRLSNFAELQRHLGSRNRLRIGAPLETDVPFCYPLLVDGEVPWEQLWKAGVFAPVLWPEVKDHMLARRLMPLPVDHRYGVDDMRRVAGIVSQVLGW